MLIAVLARTACAAAIALSASGCVRTYDGSIMPPYETTIVHAGPVPLLAFRKTRAERGDTAYEFPSAPRRPVYAPTAGPVQPRVTRVRNRPRAVAAAPRREPAPTVRCRDAITDGGRVKVLCE